MDPIALLAALLAVALTVAIAAALRRRAPRGSGRRLPAASKAGWFGARARAKTGWRAVQEAGKSRTRARNKAGLAAPTAPAEDPRPIGKAHRTRLARKSWGGPWR